MDGAGDILWLSEINEEDAEMIIKQLVTLLVF